MDEPVRGRIPDPGLLALSGLDQMRAFLRGLAPSTPLGRLTGARLTQVNSGSIVLTQAVTPWFDINEGFVDLTIMAEAGMWVAAVTGAPPASHVHTVNLSLRYLRPCTVESETIIVRARIVHAGGNFTTVEALIEDAPLGRAVAHATGSFVVRSMNPPPPAVAHAPQPVEEPVYATPDPPRRPVTPRQRVRLGDFSARLRDVDDPSLLPPFAEFLGIRLVDLSENKAKGTLRATEWFCQTSREVAVGVLGAFGSIVLGWAIGTIGRFDERLVVINGNFTSLAPVPPDGQVLTAVGVVRNRKDERLVGEMDIAGPSGETIFTGQGTMLLLERRPDQARRTTNRLLLTVLFTDVVGSTARARELGDAGWGKLLEEHNAVVRRQLHLFQGREIKTTGDGFLAVFDSATRAVSCAQAIRTALKRLDLSVRAGVHAGECDVAGGDVSGLAVHVASRVQAAADPGELLVTGTVRDLTSGSGLRFVDRGDRILRDLEGKWPLYAVDDEPAPAS